MNESASHTSSARVVFIGGYNRSGSTLLERILGELPGVRALGEVIHIWTQLAHTDVRCGCGTPHSACEFWTAVGQEAFGGWDNIDLRRIPILRQEVGRSLQASWRLRLPIPEGRVALVTEFADYHARVYAAAAAVSNTPIVIDSSKYAGFAYCLRWARNLDLRVVHLVRDPRGVAYSMAKPRSSSTGKPGALRGSPPAVSTLRWNGHNLALSLLSRARQAGSGQLLRTPPLRRIRYEDLISAPRKTVRALAEFADLPVSDSDLSYIEDSHVSLGPIHSAGGNPNRFTVGRIPLRIDDAWRTSAPPRQRRVVGALCAPLMTAYGYPFVAGPPSRAR